MCGIAGFYGFRDNNLIKKISQEIYHRGPNGEGFYIDNNVSLLNRRLAIIDVAGGNQPIYNEDKSLAVVFNGEIYNYKDLRLELEKKGHLFKTYSDTEVIVHSYEEWGISSFDLFNGMFAFALYDIKNEKLILARDHFGIKPLYYSIIDQNKQSLKLIFSSEIKPIIYSGLLEKKPNDKVIYRYLKYRIHDEGEETFFQGVFRLLAGSFLEIEKGKLKVRTYTNLKNDLLNNRVKKITDKEIKDFQKKLIEAVRLRLISEVPVGTCLSGGIDSSTIVAIVNNLLNKKIKEADSLGDQQKTFSAVFPGGSNDEERYIDQVINSLNKIKAYKVLPKSKEFIKDLSDFIKTQEEPTISTGPYAQYKVMQLAKGKVTVLLDGQGADEMLAGYYPYYFVYWRQLLKERKYLTLLKELVFSFDVFFRFFIKKINLIFRIKKSLNPNLLFRKDFLEKFKEEKFLITNDNLKKRLIEDIFQNSLPSLLRYEDKNSMRFSIEGRVPFLDFNLLRFIFSLPEEVIIKNGWNKFLLRQAMKDFLPKIVVKRRNKIGFTTPEYQWFFEVKDDLYKIFLSKSFASRKYFNQREVLLAFEEFLKGKIDDTLIFWRILNLELWLREFFDEEEIDKKEINYQFGKPNKEKKLIIEVEEKKYQRYPIRTDLFQKGDKFMEKIKDYFIKSLGELEKIDNLKDKKIFLVISEKIVAISQGRSYFISEIKPGFWAKLLSKFVQKTPYGIGLGSPWTMQLAINEASLLKILLATLVSALTKPLGIKGLFYKITGKNIASIDGPTEYSVYPANISAKLGPKEPEKVVKEIDKKIFADSQFLSLKKKLSFNFLGTVIIDANDLGQKVLGNSTNLDSLLIEKVFKDNPMGQADEQTPIIIVVKS